MFSTLCCFNVVYHIIFGDYLKCFVVIFDLEFHYVARKLVA